MQNLNRILVCYFYHLTHIVRIKHLATLPNFIGKTHEE